jgi:hypothetical protein
MKKVQITLELNERSVKRIERYLKEFDNTTFKEYLENEINNNPDEFIEYSGLDNM